MLRLVNYFYNVWKNKFGTCSKQSKQTPNDKWSFKDVKAWLDGIEFKPRIRFTGESEEWCWVEDAADVELDDRREDGVGRRRRPVAVHFARHWTQIFD